jgi:hypothetical protein
MEILENTLIRLISRQGADSDRKNTLLNSGEFGYTTDLKRLYIGDGFTNGGVLVGNKFLGSASDITTFAPALIGDMVFNPVKNKLYELQSNNGSLFTDWKLIAGVYSSSDNKITISDNNVITMNLLSAYSLHPDLLIPPLTLGAGKIALNPLSSYSLSNDAVSGLIKIESGRVTLNPLSAYSLHSDLVMSPMTLSAGKLALNPLSSYSLSNDAVSGLIKIESGRVTLNPLSAYSLHSDLVMSPMTLSAGKLALNPLSAYSLSNDLVSGFITLSAGKLALSAIPFQSVSTKTMTISSGLTGYIDGVDVTGSSFNPLSSNVIIKSNQLQAVYNGSLGSMTYARGITGTKVSTGSYKFFYTAPTSNIYPTVTIMDYLSPQIPIVRNMTNTSCEVSVLVVGGGGSFPQDSNISLTLSY